jgi:hypothetical protein
LQISFGVIVICLLFECSLNSIVCVKKMECCRAAEFATLSNRVGLEMQIEKIYVLHIYGIELL